MLLQISAGRGPYLLKINTEAARDVASMVERELGFLEAARDWAEGDAPSSDLAAGRAS